MKHALFRRIVARTGGEIAGGRTLYAWNDLLKTYPGAIGIKTGHTDLAGWSEIVAAERDGVTMYSVILGGPSATAVTTISPRSSTGASATTGAYR